MQLSTGKSLVRATICAVAVLGMGSCGGGGGGSPDPVLGNLSFSTAENVALSAQLTATDPGGGQLTFSQVGQPKSGKVSGFSASGQFVYQPNPGFAGSDSFPIQVADSAAHTSAGIVSITVTVNHPPTANNTIARADGAQLTSINVLAQASDPDNDKLTVTIIGAPLVGQATVNNDGTVRLTGLPAGFKGLTRFTYEVTDPSGASAPATAVIFVGADPFRATFVGDAKGDGSYEVYLADFAANPQVLTRATKGTMRLSGYAVSDNGATVVYRVQDTISASNTSLSLVQTAAPDQQVSIPLPSGTVPVLDAAGGDQFKVSPNGRWIAIVAGQGNTSSLYVVNVSNPTVVTQVAPAGAAFASRPRFSLDSNNVYFLASSVPGGTAKSLYYASLADPGATTLISSPSDPATSDDVSAYSVSPDQSRILIQAVRSGRLGLFYIDPQHLQTEIQVSLPPGVGNVIAGSTIDLPPGRGGATSGERVAYTVEVAETSAVVGTYVAEVSATPNPRLVAAAGQALGFRPDDAAILYTKGAEVFESVIDSGTADAIVGGGINGWYDSTGNIVALEQFLASSGSSPYPALASTFRGSFGTTQPVGLAAMATQYINVTGFDRGVVIIGQNPITASAPASTQLELVNALAPADLLPLASFQSPLQLTSDTAQVVSH